MSNEGKWVIVELSRQGEKKEPEELENLLRSEIGDEVGIFIPSETHHKENHSVTVCLMEGYVFIEAGLPMAHYFDLESTASVSSVLTRNVSDGREVRCIPSSEIDSLRNQLKKEASKNLEEGDRVLITEGTYAHMEGEIIGFHHGGEDAQVNVDDLKSVDVMTSVPAVFLEKVPEQD